MLKILYIVSTLKSGGPTNQLFNIIKNLDRHIFKPIVLTLSSEPKESKWRDYESLGIEMYSFNLSRIEGFFFLESRLKNLIKKIAGKTCWQLPYLIKLSQYLGYLNA